MNEQKHLGGKKDLGSVALVGSTLQMAGRGLRALTGLATVAVLARFLSPSDFGAFAIIYALVMFAQVFADLGLRIALVQKADISDIECHSVFWTSTIAGTLLTALLIVFAHPIAALFENPQLAPSIMAVSPIFILVGMRGVPLALLERRFLFKEIAATDLAAAVIGSLSAIAFAVAGSTVGALVAQQLAMVVVLTVMLFRYSRWTPRFQFSREALRPLAGYGSFVTLSGILQSASPMIDRPLIGTRLSTADLGYLTMSDQIIMTPVRVIASNVRRVTFPVLSSIQNDDARIVTAHRSTLHALALALTPCIMGLAALAEPLSVLLLGPAWAPVATIMAIIALRALAGSVGELNSAVFASKGAARFQFLWSLFNLGLSVAILLATIPFGVEAVALGRLFASLVVFLPLHNWFLGRLLGTSTASLFTPLARPTLAAIIMAVGVYALDTLLEAQGLGMLVRAAAGIALGGLAYTGLILLIDRQQALALWGKVRNVRARRG